MVKTESGGKQMLYTITISTRTILTSGGLVREQLFIALSGKSNSNPPLIIFL